MPCTSKRFWLEVSTTRLRELVVMCSGVYEREYDARAKCMSVALCTYGVC